MKITRPARPEVPFKRKRTPPPQATKLLTYSLGAGIVFMVLLGIVFLPRMFVDQTPVAILDLRFNATTAHLDVASVTFALPVANFRAVLSKDNATLATLDAGLRNGTATLSFVDANGNGLLDAGDSFAISVSPAGQYRFEVFQVDVNRRVGFVGWTGSP